MAALDTIALQFSTSESSLGNWASALIRRINHSPFSHVDIEMPDGNLLGASDMGAGSPCIQGNPQGVAIRPPQYQTFGYRRRMVIATDRADAIRTVALTQLGKPFDGGSLWDFVSDHFPGERDWRDNGSWFCAELIVWAFELGGFWPYTLPWPKNRVSPTDLLLVLLMDPRWINRDIFWQQIPQLKLHVHER